MGTEFTQVAVAWQLYELTESPLQVGLIGLARVIPLLSLGLFGGLLADAVDRRRLMMATQIAQCSLSSTLVVASLTGAVTPLLLYLVSGALALCTALDSPARQSIVPNLIPREHLASGLALINTQTKLGSVAGPSLAGIALAFAGPALCYAVDATSWLTMLVALVLVKPSTGFRAAGRRLSLKALSEGVGFVAANPVILSAFVLDCGARLLGNNRALLPAYAKDILNVGAPGLGLMFAATSAGAIVAAAAMSIVPPIRRMGIWALTGVAVYGTCTAIFAVSHNFGLALLMLAGVGAGNSVSVVLRDTVTQLSSPNDLRGRVASVGNLFSSSGPQLGQLQSGAVAELVSVPAAALIGGVATVLFTGVMAILPALRTFESSMVVGSTPQLPRGERPQLAELLR